MPKPPQPTIGLDALIPNKGNPRKITERAFAKLCASIRRDPTFMELRPIIIDEANVIIGGNQRYRACLELGKKVVPASWIRTAKLTEEQRRRFIVMDNAPDGVSGYWDFDALKEDWTLADLEEIGFLFADTVNQMKEWQGMPAFENEQFFKELLVRFMRQEDFEAFARLIEQQLGRKTKSIWYPEQNLDLNATGKVFTDE